MNRSWSHDAAGAGLLSDTDSADDRAPADGDGWFACRGVGAVDDGVGFDVDWGAIDDMTLCTAPPQPSLLQIAVALPLIPEQWMKSRS
jgi:hypothetical protein